MISEPIRQAILTLKEQGRPLREISRALKVSRNTVRRVLRTPHLEGKPARCTHQEAFPLIQTAFTRCRGNVVRVQEVLREDHQLDSPYSTLTGLVCEAGWRHPKRRAGTYAFEPGEEMQHDTSPHHVVLGHKTVTTQCAAPILAYSRHLFVQFGLWTK